LIHNHHSHKNEKQWKNQLENPQFFDGPFMKITSSLILTFFFFSFPKNRSCMSLVLKFQNTEPEVINKLKYLHNTENHLQPILHHIFNSSWAMHQINWWKLKLEKHLRVEVFYSNAQNPWCQVTTLFTKCIKYMYIYILERTLFQVPFGLKESLNYCASGLKDNYSILSWVKRIKLPSKDNVGLNFKPCIRYTYHSFWLLVHTRIHNGLLKMEIASQIWISHTILRKYPEVWNEYEYTNQHSFHLLGSKQPRDNAWESVLMQTPSGSPPHFGLLYGQVCICHFSIIDASSPTYEACCWSAIYHLTSPCLTSRGS
jgi:hypothetical protein